jgi:hypothetical protein
MKKYSNENVFLNSINDLTRQAYNNDTRNTPLNNKKSSIARFESDIFINKKEEFESNNSKINSLNDEIRELKSKLKLISEKDEKIYELEINIKKKDAEIEQLSNTISELKIYETKNKELIGKNEKYQIEMMNLDSLKQRNELLTIKLIELTKKATSNIQSENKETDFKSKDNEEKTIAIDKQIDDKIKVDVNQIKNILNNRLKSYQEEHIHKLISEYELSKKEYISKSDMTELLNKAIHI